MTARKIEKGAVLRPGATRLGSIAAVIIAAAMPVTSLWAETILVEADRYIVQRREVAGTSRAVQTYRIAKQFRSFDVVVPKRAALLADLDEKRTEPLNWSKVSADCAEIMKDPDVRSCDPNFIRQPAAVPNDPAFTAQWALSELSNAVHINAQMAWDFGVGTSEVLVGVIDSGIFTSHPDLIDNIWRNPLEVIDGVDNDGNGYIDDVSGANTALGTSQIGDCDGHGTHVSGIIGARGNNSLGVAGVNWVTGLVTARTDTDCTGSATLQAVLNAYDYFVGLKARGHNIRVVNASYGGAGYAQAEYEAIERLQASGILLVAAAGNDSTNIDAVPFYPASMPLPNVIAVAATGPDGRPAEYTNYGAGTVHIAAPGGDARYADGGIFSTWSTAATPSALYRSIQGTSMACPMVTGALALVASQRPGLSSLQLRQLLFDSARVVPELQGIVRAGRFLNIAQMSTQTAPVDQCPDDENKFAPGVCGCGVVDSDRNGNGSPDCLDPIVRERVPTRPRLRIKGRRLYIAMENLPGVEWYIEVVSSFPSKNSRQSTSRSRYFIGSTATTWVPKPARGVRVKVRYAFRVAGSRNDFSYWSRYREL